MKNPTIDEQKSYAKASKLLGTSLDLTDIAIEKVEKALSILNPKYKVFHSDLKKLQERLKMAISIFYYEGDDKK